MARFPEEWARESGSFVAFALVIVLGLLIYGALIHRYYMRYRWQTFALWIVLAFAFGYLGLTR